MAAAVILMAALPGRAEEILPKHITPKTQAAIQKGLDFLAKSQSQDGSFSSGDDGGHYPVGMTSLAGMAFLANGNTPSMVSAIFSCSLRAGTTMVSFLSNSLDRIFVVPFCI